MANRAVHSTWCRFRLVGRMSPRSCTRRISVTGELLKLTRFAASALNSAGVIMVGAHFAINQVYNRVGGKKKVAYA